MRNSPGRRWSAWGLIVALGASQAAPAAWAAPTDTTLRQAASAQNPDTVQRLQSGLEEPSPAQPAASPAPRGIVSGSDLVVGQDYGRANDLNGVVFSRAVTVQGAPFELPGGITVNPNGGTITIGSGAKILQGAIVQGPGVIGAEARIGGRISGMAERPFVVGAKARVDGLALDVQHAVIGPGVKVQRAAHIKDTVIVGESSSVGTGTILEAGAAVFGREATVGTDVKLRKNAVIGPFVTIGHNSEHKAVLYIGASEEAGIEFPHEGYTGSVWAIPIQVTDANDRPIPYGTQAYYARLRQIVRVILLGEDVSDEAVGKGPVSSTGLPRRVTRTLDGEPVTFLAQRINFGANTITSDYNPMTGAKTGALVEAGVATGVDSVIKSPVRLGAAALVGNLSQATGDVSLGTLIMGLVKGGYAELGGYRLGDSFALGDHLAEEIEAQMDYFERLCITAEVLAEGARRAPDPFTLAGYWSALNAVRNQFDELGSRYSKVLGPALDASIATLTRRVAETAGDKTRLAQRLQTQLEIKHNAPGIRGQIKQLGQTIDRVMTDVNRRVSQPVIAEAAAALTVNPATVWTNPLDQDRVDLPVSDRLARVIEWFTRYVHPASAKAKVLKAGTDGVRWLVGTDDAWRLGFVEGVAAAGRALRAARERGQSEAWVAMARDGRKRSELEAQGALAAVRLMGVNVTDFGIDTTPGLQSLVKANTKYGAGLVFTASHNPDDDLGVKLLGPTGDKVEDAFEAAATNPLLAATRETADGVLRQVLISQKIESLPVRAGRVEDGTADWEADVTKTVDAIAVLAEEVGVPALQHLVVDTANSPAAVRRVTAILDHPKFPPAFRQVIVPLNANNVGRMNRRAGAEWVEKGVDPRNGGKTPLPDGMTMELTKVETEGVGQNRIVLTVTTDAGQSVRVLDDAFSRVAAVAVDGDADRVMPWIFLKTLQDGRFHQLVLGDQQMVVDIMGLQVLLGKSGLTQDVPIRAVQTTMADKNSGRKIHELVGAPVTVTDVGDRPAREAAQRVANETGGIALDAEASGHRGWVVSQQAADRIAQQGTRALKAFLELENLSAGDGVRNLFPFFFMLKLLDRSPQALNAWPFVAMPKAFKPVKLPVGLFQSEDLADRAPGVIIRRNPDGTLQKVGRISITAVDAATDRILEGNRPGFENANLRRSGSESKPDYDVIRIYTWGETPGVARWVLDQYLEAFKPFEVAGAGLEEVGLAEPVEETLAPDKLSAGPSGGVAGARQLLGDLKQMAVDSAAAERRGAGIIAGPELVDGVSGVAHAIVLRQQLGVPVVLLVESEAQRDRLIATEFFTADEVLVAGTGALELAEQRLMTQGVPGGGLVYLGVPNQPTTVSLEDLLNRLGVDLSAYPVNLLQYRASEVAKQVLGQYV